MSALTPDVILRDATEMAAHYPHDRLRLTGVEVLALVEHVRTAAYAQGVRDGLERAAVHVEGAWVVVQAIASAIRGLKEET